MYYVKLFLQLKSREYNNFKITEEKCFCKKGRKVSRFQLNFF